MSSTLCHWSVIHNEIHNSEPGALKVLRPLVVLGISNPPLSCYVVLTKIPWMWTRKHMQKLELRREILKTLRSSLCQAVTED